MKTIAIASKKFPLRTPKILTRGQITSLCLEGTGGGYTESQTAEAMMLQDTVYNAEIGAEVEIPQFPSYHFVALGVPASE